MTAEPSSITAHATEADHEGAGLALLARQFAGKARVEALLRALLGPVQEVEDDVWGLYALGITTSPGAALDQLGAVLGQVRPAGLSDAVYRLVLRGAVRVLRSSGTGEELLAALGVMLDGDAFTMVEAFPASLVFEPAAPTDVSAAVLLEVLRRGVSAGVRLQVVDVPEGSDLFTFSSDAETSETGSEGFSDVTGVPGGALVGVVST